MLQAIAASKQSTVVSPSPSPAIPSSRASNLLLQTQALARHALAHDLHLPDVHTRLNQPHGERQVRRLARTVQQSGNQRTPPPQQQQQHRMCPGSSDMLHSLNSMTESSIVAPSDIPSVPSDILSLPSDIPSVPSDIRSGPSDIPAACDGLSWLQDAGNNSVISGHRQRRRQHRTTVSSTPKKLRFNLPRSSATHMFTTEDLPRSTTAQFDTRKRSKSADRRRCYDDNSATQRRQLYLEQLMRDIDMSSETTSALEPAVATREPAVTQGNNSEFISGIYIA